MSFSSGKTVINNIDLDDAQTLSNKTLDSSNAINGAAITGSTVTNPSIVSPTRLDVKKDTLANLQTYAASATNGQMCFATDSKKMYQVLDSALAEVGSGQGGINYIENFDFEVNVSGWSAYANTTPSALPDDFLGSVNGSFDSPAASTPALRGSKSLYFGGINSGNDLQGHGIYSDFTIDPADKAKKLTGSFDYKIDDSAMSNAVDGFFRVYIYCLDTSALIRVNGEDIYLNANTGTHYFQFQTDASSLNYRLVIHQAVGLVSAESYSMAIDNVKVGPTELAKGTIVTDWESYTPTITGFGSITNNVSYYRRVGDSLEVSGSFTSGTVTATSGSIQIPNGLNINTDKTSLINNTSNSGNLLGHYSNSTGTQTGYLVSAVSTSTTLVYFTQNLASSISNIPSSSVSGNVMGSGGTVSYKFSVPILGWSANSTMSEDLGGREVVVEAYGNSGQTITSSQDIPYEIKVEDTTASWNGTQFIVPETGYYDIDVGFRTTANNLANLKLMINGVLYREKAPEVSYIVHNSVFSSVLLTKGDILTFRHAAASLTLQSDSSFHRIRIAKRSSPQTILETETVAARYTSNSGQSIPNSTDTVIIYEDIDYDTHNSYNTSTGVYTVPVSGKYRVSASIFLSATPTSGSSRALLDFTNYKGSTVLIGSSTTSGYGNMIASGSIEVDLVKGDTHSIRINQDTGASKSLNADGRLNHFSIARIK